MWTIAFDVLIFAAGYLIGTKGVPATVAWLKTLESKRAISAAKALVAKAEADAAALEAAKKVVATAPVAPAPAAPATPAAS
jgi:hypothetical protein